MAYVGWNTRHRRDRHDRRRGRKFRRAIQKASIDAALAVKLIVLRIEGVIGEDRSHVYLSKQRFDVRAKAMEDGNDVLLLGGRKNLFREPLDGLPVLVK